MARKGDLIQVNWQDAEHCEDVELSQSWAKYKITVHETVGILLYNGERFLVITSSKERATSHGDVYVIPKDKWILELTVLKTKRQMENPRV